MSPSAGECSGKAMRVFQDGTDAKRTLLRRCWLCGVQIGKPVDDAK
ncbi:hypothetical protein IPS52_01915 [Xanthomonas perforans]|nr:hypothetical protein [Xanthomonas perforans]MBZ2855472.1 hypothetical protein [Xanthomonas perforans]MBZ2941330.1 hypothetical protein [Xanthomonas perforans]MBZ3002560.1 hypothetical protein [Xanthomonas perforans]MBZ3287637.1 hypothetical protein [Xanthomonas perforans]